MLEISWPDIPNTDQQGEKDLTKENDKVSNIKKKLFISVEALSSIPKPHPKSKKAKGIQKATVLTSSPYKTQLELSKELQFTQEKLKKFKDKLGKSKK